jgi:small subunit ribosomal protein S8
MTNHMASDMASRVRNAIQVHQPSVDVQNTYLTRSIARILLQEGFIYNISTSSIIIVNNESREDTILTLHLRYNDCARCLTHIKIISKPGVRMYSRANDIPRILGGLGILILSTSQGVITDKGAGALGIGGEVLCSIW